MIFNSKQLEELENIHDSTGAFEEEADDEGFSDEVGEAAMDWRRGLIEEAAESIKRAKTRPVEPHIQYPIGSMLFDRDVRRFARVQRSVPGYLKIVYLSGGDREFGALDVTGYLREYGAGKRVSEMAEQLGMQFADVAHELDRLGIVPLDEPEPVEAAPEAAAAPAAAPVPAELKPRRAKAEEAEPEEDEEAAAPADDVDDLPTLDDGKAPASAKGKKGAGGSGRKPAANEKLVEKYLAPGTAGTPRTPGTAGTPRTPGTAGTPRTPGTAGGRAAKPAAPAPKTAKPAAVPDASKPEAKKKGNGKGVNPIDDPNGYIKANFNEMSNRELARLTGLSEHTIRRKLGEWGLKRKREL